MKNQSKIYEVEFGLPVEKEVKNDAIRFVFDGYAYQVQEDEGGGISIRKISTSNESEQLVLRVDTQNKIIIR